jgi:hypothetical protein
MYLRFQGHKPNLGTASRLGIFQLAFELRDRHDLPDYVYDELQLQLNWLKKNLTSPNVLDRDSNYRAICWFKTNAREPLKRIWAIKAILNEFGYHIDVIKTKHPGIVIYEDGWQVVAKPPRKSSKSSDPSVG